jgi:hypothetical protein
MPVVIDDFEVLTGDEEVSEPSTVTTTAASSPTVHDIERVIERQWERFERTWAH